ncbi:MAG: arsenate reductase family protein [Bacteroidia bacterium]|jgi:arsenate reductase
MKITILHNPRCSKSRAALAEAEACHAEIEIIEYLKDTPTVDELRSLIKRLGISASELVRRKESLYLEKYAGKKITEEKWLTILHKNPVLIERPILIHGKKVVLGRSQEQLDRFFKLH